MKLIKKLCGYKTEDGRFTVDCTPLRQYKWLVTDLLTKEEYNCRNLFSVKKWIKEQLKNEGIGS